MIRSTAIAATALFALAACDEDPMMSASAAATAGGMTYDQARAEYPDMSAVEFDVLDDNNDGLLSAEEAMDIGTDADELTIDDDA